MDSILNKIYKVWGVIWFGSFIAVNSMLWIYEDINNLEHKTYIYDHMIIIVWLIVGGLLLITDSRDKDG